MFSIKSNSGEAFNTEKKIVVMKHLTILKNLSDEAFNASLLHCCQRCINPCRNHHKTGQNSPNT
jgi:hypothetical protein